MTLTPLAESPRPTRRYVPEADAAAYMSMTARFLESRRLKGTGPRYIRLSSRCIRYDLAELDRWMAEQARTSTSDNGDAVDAA